MTASCRNLLGAARNILLVISEYFLTVGVAESCSMTEQVGESYYYWIP